MGYEQLQQEIARLEALSMDDIKMDVRRSSGCRVVVKIIGARRGKRD